MLGSQLVSPEMERLQGGGRATVGISGPVSYPLPLCKAMPASVTLPWGSLKVADLLLM